MTIGNFKITYTNEVAVIRFTDYYPYGSVMRSEGEKYRFGYQGEFAEQDDETGWNAFELRMYDSKIGRWMAPDPYRQYWSPYMAMGNNPMSLVDPDGGCDDPPCDEYTSDVVLSTVYVYSNPDKVGVGDAVAIGRVAYEPKYFGASFDFSFMQYNAYYTQNGRLAMSAVANVSYFREKVSIRIGSMNNNVSGSASLDFLYANAELSGGILTGNDGKTGFSGKLEGGLYTANIEGTYGGSFLGIETKITVGVSGASAHAGINGGVYYDEKTGKLHINEVSHLGLGVGAKEGIDIAIPVSWLWE